MKEEFIGEWFYPNDKDKRIHGILVISENNQIMLTLTGEIEDLNSLGPQKIINGIESKGKLITLIDCMQTGAYFNTEGKPIINYIVYMMITGAHYNSIENIKIKTFKSNYTDLSKWISVNPFDFEYNKDNDGFVVKCNFESMKIYDIKDFKFIIKSGYPTECNLYDKLTILRKPYVEFELKERKNILESIEIAKHFGNLLTMCIGKRVSYYDTEFIDVDDNRINIIFNKMTITRETDIDRDEIFITYNTVKDNFEDMLQQWYKDKEKLQPIINSLVEVIGEDTFKIPITFMKVIQAVEAFSRRMRNNDVIDEEEHNNRINRILSVIKNEDDKIWLSDILKYSNEPPLPKRLKNLLKELDFLVKTNSKEKDKLCWKISKTRNYYTHFDESNKEQIMNIDEIFRFTRYIQLALRILILIDLGISQESIKKSIINNLDARFTRDYFKKEFSLQN